ncbi:MAG: phenylalanine--tRNA ligase subunit beta [Desulfurococcaceae archaeon]
MKRTLGDTMPVVKVSRRDLESLLKVKLEASTIYKTLARLKCEVERVQDDVIEYEVTSDRPDLFSVEGLARALRPWLGLKWREFTVVESSVVGHAKSIPQRPYLALAVVRDLALSDEAISQIMQLQEKITQTYGRARRKISIGVYDLDELVPPIYYDLADPDLTFRPLGELREMTLREIIEKTEKGILYGYIIKHMEKYPVLRDSRGNVLSLVPIINSEDCRVRPATKNVLIDATGMSADDVVNAVTIMATSIVERSESGIVEVVKVHYENGIVVEAPKRTAEPVEVPVEEVNDLIGVQLGVDDIAQLLKMFYYDVVSSTDRHLKVKPPIYRIDVKSWVDVAEDVAMAYGYEKLGSEAGSLPPSNVPGKISPIEYLSRRLRDILVGLGFQEVANYMMSCRAVQLDVLGLQHEMFLVENPRSERFEGIRIWLAPQLLEVVKENSERYSRLMVFEIGDVVVPDANYETLARVERRLGIAIMHDKATITDGLAYTKSILSELGVTPVFVKGRVQGFLPERTAVVLANGSELGFVGEVDPRVLCRLELKNPVVIAELDLHKVLSLCTR